MKSVTLLLPIITGSKIVYSDYRCTDAGGVCQTNTQACSGTYVSGLCDGLASRQCCVDADYACTQLGGTCQNNKNKCDGNYLSGYCSGSASNQCCAPGTAGTCPLVKYTSNYILGYYKSVWVEPGFDSAMKTIESAAKSAGVTVYVTQAYRKDGVPVDGAIVPPSSHSNHLVGHSIDCNLDTPLGWCNGDCMLAAYFSSSVNKYAYDFLHEITKSTLRWGGFFAPTDPVHIDDNTYLNSASKWQTLYDQIQPFCNSVDS